MELPSEIKETECPFFDNLKGIIKTTDETKTNTGLFEGWNRISLSQNIAIRKRQPEEDYSFSLQISGESPSFKTNLILWDCYNFVKMHSYKMHDQLSYYIDVKNVIENIITAPGKVYAVEGPPEGDWVVWAWVYTNVSLDVPSKHTPRFSQAHILYNLFLKDLSVEIRESLPPQKELPIDDLKGKINDLFMTFLSREELRKARELIQFAIKIFPGDKKFKIAQGIIAPPEFVSSNKPATDGIRETIQFFKNLGKEFEKKWIAVSKGQFLGFSDSYKQLTETFKDKDVFITKVL